MNNTDIILLILFIGLGTAVLIITALTIAVLLIGANETKGTGSCYYKNQRNGGNK